MTNCGLASVPLIPLEKVHLRITVILLNIHFIEIRMYFSLWKKSILQITIILSKNIHFIELYCV